MPCYEVQTTSVEFHADNLKLLEKALKALKWPYTLKNKVLTIQGSYATQNIVIDLSADQATITGNAGAGQQRLNELKRGYSLEAVKYAAQMNSWGIGKVKTVGTETVGVMTRY